MKKVIFKQENESVVKDAFYEKLYNLNSENTIELAELFFNNLDVAFSAVDVDKALGYKGNTTVNHRVRDLARRGFLFENLAGNGKPGLWKMVGVEFKVKVIEKKKGKCPVPTLNPFIEAVFC